MSNWSGFVCSLIVCFFVISPAVFAANGTRVIDGDTIKIGEITYRLHGIDAPEFGQKCAKRGGGKWDCGKEATTTLAKLVQGHEVYCEGQQQDGYGRTIAVCKTAGFELNSKMIELGFAWAFVKFSDDYLNVERAARSKGRGVFQAKTETPWEYRNKQWEVATQQAPDGCPIKGNISRNGRIYHAPWSPWYSRTKINLEKGERWFCDEAEAIAAGWRAPIWGN